MSKLTCLILIIVLIYIICAQTHTHMAKANLSVLTQTLTLLMSVFQVILIGHMKLAPAFSKLSHLNFGHLSGSLLQLWRK